MSHVGRPPDSGYRSQIVLLWLLTIKSPMYFHELAKEANIDENRIAPNLRLLIEKGLIKNQRNGHKMMYEVFDKEKGNRYLWDQFIASSRMEFSTTPKESKIPDIPIKPETQSNWKMLKEGTDFVVDKKIGVITFSEMPKNTIRATYKAGYERTPEPIQEASARPAGGFLRWLFALKSKHEREAVLISKETFRKVAELCAPFKKCNTDSERDKLLKEVAERPYQLRRLEESEGLKYHSNYAELLKWLKEMKTTEKLTKTRSIRRGVRQEQVGPKHQEHKNPNG